MSRWMKSGLVIGLLCIVNGCSMCCGPDDYAYPTYGGKWQRTDRVHGRVGSNLSDAGDTIASDEAVGEQMDYEFNEDDLETADLFR